MSTKLAAGSAFPLITIPKLGGGTLTVGEQRDRWLLVVIYRGRHCPKCKTYLGKLEAMKADWEAAGIDIIVASGDPEDKAKADQAEFGWSLDLGYGLSEPQMAQMGLYISDPLSEAETDRRFPEPGLFVLRPDGVAQVVAISNAPAARPDLAELLPGMIFTIENSRPPRGMAS